MIKRPKTIMLECKKGQVEEFLENAFRIGFMIIAMLVFFVLISLYINNQIDTRLLQAETLASRIIYSDVITYSDRYTSRTYPGIIDVEKIDDSELNKNIGYSFTMHAAAKIKIYKKPVLGKEEFIKEAYLNRDQFKNWKSMIDANVRGKGSAVMTVKEFPATCIYNKNQGSYEYCTLVIEVIVPNS